MRYKKIKFIDKKVSVISLGGNIFGYLTDYAQTHKLLTHAKEYGVNTIDTADVYSNGLSESYIGDALYKNRQDWVIATKCGLQSHQAPGGLGRKNSILSKLDSSLRRLRTDYIDIYQMHHFDSETPLEETFSTLSDCVKAGKIRAIGVSNYSLDQLQRSILCINENNFEPIVSAQCHFNLFKFEAMRNFFPTCHAHSISVLPYGVLARGILGAKYSSNKLIPVGSRAEISDSIRGDLSDEVLFAVSNLKFYSESLNLSLATLATAWVLANSHVTSAILGIRDIEQLADAVASVTLDLDKNIYSKLLKESVNLKSEFKGHLGGTIYF